MPTPVHPYSEYGVALRTLRSARSWLGLGLFLCVMAQILGFLLMWTTTQPYVGLRAQYQAPEKTQWDELKERIDHIMRPPNATQASPGGAAAVQPEEFYPGSEQGRKLNVRKQWEATYTATVALTQIVGLMAVCSQVVVMFLTLLLILVAQAPGVVHVTRGLIWSILLLFMVMPWQYFAANFPFRGVLYGYQEMLGLIGKHVVVNTNEKIYVYERLYIYGRFLAWPLVALFILLIVSERFRAGIMLAIGHPLQTMMQPRGGKPAAPAATLPRA